MPFCATLSASNFEVLMRSGRRDSTLRTFICFLAGPAREMFEYVIPGALWLFFAAAIARSCYEYIQQTAEHSRRACMYTPQPYEDEMPGALGVGFVAAISCPCYIRVTTNCGDVRIPTALPFFFSLQPRWRVLFYVEPLKLLLLFLGCCISAGELL